MKHAQPLGIALVATLILVTGAPAANAATRSSRPSDEDGRYSWFSRNLPSAAQKVVTRLQRQDALEVIPVPILLGVKPGDFADTWGDARSQGRVHEGTDILAPKDAYIVAPTESVVSDIGEGANGGNFVYTINPGGERYYFAHLDKYADGLRIGDVLQAGDLIGYVGNTGNASGGPTHLHFGIYTNGGAVNPYERLSETLSTSTRVEAINAIIEDADDGDAEARVAVGAYPAFFRAAAAEGFDFNADIADALAKTSISPTAATPAAIGVRDLTLGSQGADVAKLQTILMSQGKGPAATTLSGAGATGYFAPMTRAALVEWQADRGVTPASGYFGPITRAKMSAMALL